MRYEEPKMGITCFEGYDIITLSGGEGDGGEHDPSTVSLQFD